MDSITSNHILMDLLANHAVPVKEEMDEGMDIISIPGTDVKLRSEVYMQSEVQKAIQMDVKVRSQHYLGNRTLIESFAGVGNTLDDAVLNAFDKFCRASLHPIMAVFINRSLGGDQVQWEKWTRGNHTWGVFLGPLLIQENPPQESNTGSINYSNLLDEFRDAFLPEASFQTHWLRYFRGSLNGKCIGREALLDNEAWSPGEAILDRWLFPDIMGYQSIRQFLIALPVPAKKKWWKFW